MNSRCLRVNSLSLRLFKVSLLLNVLLEHHELPHVPGFLVFGVVLVLVIHFSGQPKSNIPTLGDLRFRTSIETCQFQDLPNSEPLSGFLNIDFFNL